jgi:hypothetical protein
MASATVTTTVPVPVPTQTVAGDVLLAYIAGGDNTATTASTVTPPAGWTLIVRTDASTYGLFAVYWKVAGASEPPTYSWTATGTNGGILYTTWMLAVAGLDTTQPVDVAAGQAFVPTTAGTTFTSPSLLITGAPELVIASFSGHSSGTAPMPGLWTAPAGTTQLVDVDNGTARSGSSDVFTQNSGITAPAVSSPVSQPQDFAITNAVALRPCH